MLAVLSGVLWFFAAIASLLFIAQPVSVETQLGIAVLSIGIVGAISLLRLGGVFRHVLLAISTALILRYVFWRTTSTLPATDDLLSFVPAIFLFAAEMYCILMLAMSLFVIADPLQRAKAAVPASKDLPTVDVFVPSYNESEEILALTLSAAKGLDYPADK